MASSGGEVGITSATKDAEVLIGGSRAVEGSVRGGEVERLGWENDQDGGGGVECLRPVGGRHAGMKKHRANNIVCGTNDTLGFTVLGGGVIKSECPIFR